MSIPSELERISSTTPSASLAPTNDTLLPESTEFSFRNVLRYLEYIRWPYTLQSTILLVLFIVWMIIGLFVAREVLLVVLDHRKIKFSRRKPKPKRSYHGAYSVKKKRFVREKNYQPVANGGNEIV